MQFVNSSEVFSAKSNKKTYYFLPHPLNAHFCKKARKSDLPPICDENLPLLHSRGR